MRQSGWNTPLWIWKGKYISLKIYTFDVCNNGHPRTHCLVFFIENYWQFSPFFSKLSKREFRLKKSQHIWYHCLRSWLHHLLSLAGDKKWNPTEKRIPLGGGSKSQGDGKNLTTYISAVGQNFVFQSRAQYG